MGLTYKPNVPGLRNSLAINIHKKLKKIIKNINYYDQIIDNIFDKKNNIYKNFKNISNSEIFIILVKHKEIFKSIKFLKKNKKMIIDPLSLI